MSKSVTLRRVVVAMSEAQRAQNVIVINNLHIQIYE